MLQARVAVVEREAPIERLVDLHFGPGEAETTRLLGDLEATTVPLHDVVIADDAFVHETADPFETFWNGTPSGLLFARLTGETAVVISDELAQHSVGRVDVVGFGQPQLGLDVLGERRGDVACGGCPSVGAAHRGDDEGEANEQECDCGDRHSPPQTAHVPCRATPHAKQARSDR